VPLGDLSWASAALPESIPVAAPRAAPPTRNDLRDGRSPQALSLASSLKSAIVVVGHWSLLPRSAIDGEMAYVGATSLSSCSAVSSVELPSRAANVSKRPLNPLNARRARFERITEVLGFADHLPVPELHNAHRVRRLPIVGED